MTTKQHGNRGEMPAGRLASLRALLEEKRLLRVIEAHDGLTGLIVENCEVSVPNNKPRSFDGMWISSLCDSTTRGKPDIELVDFSSRMRSLEDILEVTTKPIIYDGDTGGKAEHLVFNIRTLERLGVSAIIIEDKVGLKKNSLFGTGAKQSQESIENFSMKISAAKRAQITKEFMVIARVESLILNQGMDDALNRAHSFTAAGADGIMIHSCARTADEILEFCGHFRKIDLKTPLVVVPSSFPAVKEAVLEAAGVNIVIYANHFIRSAYPAMLKTAQSILAHERAFEADEQCLSIKEVLTLIPDELT